jgi:hypothetical protein
MINKDMLEHLKNRVKHLKHVASPLSEEDRNVRYDICKSCEHFISLTAQCSQCGCFMKAKTYIPFSECPVGKWGKFIRESEDKK